MKDPNADPEQAMALAQYVLAVSIHRLGHELDDSFRKLVPIFQMLGPAAKMFGLGNTGVDVKVEVEPVGEEAGNPPNPPSWIEEVLGRR